MGIKRRLLIIGIIGSMLCVGCVISTTKWLENISFEQGSVEIYLWQEKAPLRARNPSGGLLTIKLHSPEKIIDLKLVTSDVRLRFLKDETIVKEQEIFPEPYFVNKDNRIVGLIVTYNKYTTTPGRDKKYNLNWDDVMEVLKVSDKIECSIDLEFEANGQLYSFKKVVELKRDVKKEIVWGIAD